MFSGSQRGRCQQGLENARCSMQDAIWMSERAVSARPGERKMFNVSERGRCQQGLVDARCSMEIKEGDVIKAENVRCSMQDSQWKSKRVMSARPGERKMLNRSQKEAMSTRPGERKMLDARCSREFKAGDVNKARQEVAACAEDHGSLNESPPPLSSAYLSSKHSLPRWPAHQHSQQAVPS